MKYIDEKLARRPIAFRLNLTNQKIPQNTYHDPQNTQTFPQLPKRKRKSRVSQIVS